MKRVLSIAGNIIFTAVVLYLCYFIIQAVRNQSPAVFGYRMLRVVTDSMEPVFTGGDCILVKETGQEELAVGDIITFVSRDPSLQRGFNTHRIIDIAEDYTVGNVVYYTKGDNNRWEDEYEVLYEDIVGRYVTTLPFGKQISSFLEKLSDRNYYFAVVIIPVLLCFISSIRQLAEDIKERKS